MLHLDFGRSLQFREDVGRLIGSRLPTTLGLVSLSALLICVVGLRAGIVGALRAGRTADKAVLIVSTVLAAIPSFVAAIILISVFAVRLGWFPTFGAGDGFRPALPPVPAGDRAVADVHRARLAGDALVDARRAATASTSRSR